MINNFVNLQIGIDSLPVWVYKLVMSTRQSQKKEGKMTPENTVIEKGFSRQTATLVEQILAEKEAICRRTPRHIEPCLCSFLPGISVSPSKAPAPAEPSRRGGKRLVQDVLSALDRSTPSLSYDATASQPQIHEFLCGIPPHTPSQSTFCVPLKHNRTSKFLLHRWLKNRAVR